MKINYYLKDESKKETPIEFIIQSAFIEVTHEGKKLYKKVRRSTGLVIKPKDWNSKAQSARENESCKNYSEINSKIAEITNYINKLEKDYQEKGKELTIDIFKEKIDSFLKGEKTETKEFDFFSFADYIVANKEHKQHKRILNQTVRVLREFATATKYRIDFDSVDMDFYDKFVSYLNSRLYAKNTKAKHISNVKYFMNEAFTRKLHTNLDYKSTKFKTSKERIENIYLTDSEIETIHNFDFSKNPRLDKARDLFLIGCYTGLRFSDFTLITSANINANILSIKTKKTGKYVKIPLRPQVNEILSKYNGNAPKAISNQKLNDYLKEIGEKVGINEKILKYKSKGINRVSEEKFKYELICTHTARRSFATNCYKAGIPAKQIMLITGHTTESEFFKYIQINESENAEILLGHEYFNKQMKIA